MGASSSSFFSDRNRKMHSHRTPRKVSRYANIWTTGSPEKGTRYFQMMELSTTKHA